jgi:signal peptide peptidase SppA
VKYERIVQYIASRPWAMHPLAIGVMCDVIAARCADRPAATDFETAHGGAPFFAESIPVAAIPGQTASAIARREGRVAVLPIMGTILHRMSGIDAMSGGTSLESVQKSLAALANDNGVKAIVLNVDSLGGSVEGLAETASLIRSIRDDKPVVAQVNVRAASAAYWLASQASEIVVSPSGDVGSIGVITVHQSLAEALQKAGIDVTVIASTPYKGEGNPYGPLSEEAAAAIKADVDAFDEMFHDAVASGRGRKVADVRENFGKGRMVLAAPAVRLGMADRVGTLEETLNRFGASMMGRPARSAAQAAYEDRRRARRGFLRRAHLGAH